MLHLRGGKARAGEQQPACHVDGQLARQHRRAARAGENAEVRMGVAQLRARGGEDEIAGHHGFEPARQRQPVHGGNDRLGEGAQRVDECDHHVEEVRLAGHRRLGHFGQVGPGAEGTTVAGEHHHAHGAVVAPGIELRGHGGGHLSVQAVHGGRAVHRQPADGAFDAMLQTHGALLSTIPGRRRWLRPRPGTGWRYRAAGHAASAHGPASPAGGHRWRRPGGRVRTRRR
ncbi:hypothetical protein D3C81_1398150 [compost metagenome]